MKPLWFFSAICAGKFIRFLLWALITIFYGPQIMHTVGQTIEQHLGYVLGSIGILAGVLVFYIVRKLFGKRRGTHFPAEDEPAE
jgi:dipeptide/tripeptide permease